MNELQQRILNNFHNDIKDFIRDKLDPQYLANTYDIQNSSGLPKDDCDYGKLLGIYYLFRHRFPQGRKQVIWSRELLHNPLFHKYRKNINKIVAALNTGSSIREYLPSEIRKLRQCTFMDSQADHLLTEWGITHLHLFTRAEREKLEQSGQNDDKFLLYALSCKDNIFFIDIQDHCSMTNTSLLNITNTNSAVNPLLGFINRSNQLTPQHLSQSDIRNLRKMGIGFAVAINEEGDTFMSGLQKPAWWHACAYIDEELKAFADWCARNYDSLLKEAQNHIPECRNSDSIDIHIGFGEGRSVCNTKLDEVFIFIKYSPNDGAVILIPDNKPIEIITNILKQHDII